MLKTITVRELIEALQNEDPEARVVFASNYGDRARTQQAHAIKGECEPATLRESGYSDSGWAVDEEDGGEPSVLVIR